VFPDLGYRKMGKTPLEIIEGFSGENVNKGA